MPKRKRTDLDEETETHAGSGSEKKTRSLRAARLEQKIEHGSVLLRRALKTARGFERQKLGRRQKTARSKKEDVQFARLGEEVAALKRLDLHATAERHLIKQIVKTKRLAESPVFAQLDPSKRTLPQDGPKDDGQTANVVARLFNSNPVRNELPGIMNGIREIIGVPDAKAGESKQQPQGEEEEAPAVHAQEGHGKRRQPQIDKDVDMGESEETNYFDQFEDRLASSESEPESDAVGNRPSPTEPSGATTYDHARDLSLSPTPSEEEEGSRSQSPPAVSQKTSRLSKQSSTATTFLPSLTVGGYMSGSESEPEEDDLLQPVRKNRMGQQARRKLWEKKYGAGAKHLHKEEQNRANSRDSGWDPRRGATGADEGRRGQRGVNPRPQSRTPRIAQDQLPKNPAGGQSRNEQIADQKPLHPSWEAARKTKEQKQAAFEGKKITFDY